MLYLRGWDRSVARILGKWRPSKNLGVARPPSRHEVRTEHSVQDSVALMMNNSVERDHRLLPP